MGSTRSLARVFVPGFDPQLGVPQDLPSHEADRLRKVLRLSTGSSFLILPNDGTLVVCELHGTAAVPQRVERGPGPRLPRVRLVQSFVKAEKMEEIVRACTELGVAEFVVFPSERSVVRWEPAKLVEKVRRLNLVAKESAEVCFRADLPTVGVADGLECVLNAYPNAMVLSEWEDVIPRLQRGTQEVTLVVGPEGGWSRRECELFAGRAVTLGPLVLRVEHAGPAACALLLLESETSSPLG